MLDAQNRDSAGLKLELDELIRVIEVQNSLRGIERLSEPEHELVRDQVEQQQAQVN
jgi:low affinity Fe/Cu permease